eukprot:5045552-Amphidinium_carterae.1
MIVCIKLVIIFIDVTTAQRELSDPKNVTLLWLWKPSLPDITTSKRVNDCSSEWTPPQKSEDMYVLVQLYANDESIEMPRSMRGYLEKCLTQCSGGPLGKLSALSEGKCGMGLGWSLGQLKKAHEQCNSSFVFDGV